MISQQAYGPLTGLPRLLSMLDRRQVRATFFVPGYTAHRYPGALRDIVAAGHEVGHHGYLHESLEGVPPEVEAQFLDRGLNALEDVAGVRPVGYRAPMWEPTYATPGLLADRGFLYDSTLMDSDHPYELAIADRPGASLVEIPIQWALDDWGQYCYIPGVSGTGAIANPTATVQTWREEYAGIRDEGGCFVLTNHPFLSGRPSRVAALEQLIAEATDDPSVWVASLEEIARHVRGLQLEPRAVSRPEVPADYQ
ncbi:polysaccharide deacetylase [uncultured Kocuria sp.]|uniref:polysaccharide deacetylase family protein n=1 Tax=uncultured Kocuria sp. TaxID=259305 RepID=UPI002617493C|nr:polysaccharide deacetylase [uncultured Kocuria sp.]